MTLVWQASLVGDAIDTWSGRTGRVHSVFDRSLNASIGPDLWTFTRDDALVTPLGLAVPALDPGAVAPGMPVACRAGRVALGPAVIDARAAPLWRAAPWPGPVGGSVTRLEVAVRCARTRAWQGSAALADAVSDALCAGDDVRLGRVLRGVVGQGPGLTPSGDDVLVGFLAAATLLPRPGLLRRIVPVVAGLATHTNDISRSLLVQASRGQVSRPLHDLGFAILAPTANLACALERALDVGASSGADACLGLAAAIKLHVHVQERSAA